MNRIDRLREERPLVVCITNDVVKNFTANGLLSLGASPIMSDEQEEAEDLMKVASGLLINIGTANRQKEKLMQRMMSAANDNDVPIVLDPVGYGASDFRNSVVDDLLSDYDVSLIKGNAGEMLALSGGEGNMKGVDSVEDTDTLEIAKAVYERFGVPSLVTGRRDALVAHDRMVVMANGHELQSRITGSGCLLSAILAAFIGLEDRFHHEAVEEGVSFYNLCAEAAARAARIPAPGIFVTNLIDELYLNESDILANRLVERL